MNALQKIKNAGFEVELNNGNLVIQPFSKLTPQQIDFLKAHKAEIIQELTAANDDFPREVICYTPLGNPLSVMANNADHAAFLLAANPKPSADSVKKALRLEKGEVCKQCRYFTPDKINPPAGLGRCQQDINRKNKPLYPNQDVCEKFEKNRLVEESA